MNTFDFSTAVKTLTSNIADEAQMLEVRSHTVSDMFVRKVIELGWTLVNPACEAAYRFTEDRLMVVVSPYCCADMRCLTELAGLSIVSDRIYVVNVDMHVTRRDLARLLPGVTIPEVTPVIAHYRNDRLHRLASGRDSLEAIRQLFLERVTELRYASTPPEALLPHANGASSALL